MIKWEKFAGADISAELTAIDALVSAGGYPALTHVAGSAVGSLMGTFASEGFSQAPLTPGLSWNVSYASNMVVLSITGTATGVPGDYNENDVVDAADYTVWRDKLGGAALPNEGASPGTVDQDDYVFWKNNFGNSGSGSLSAAAVPEPASSVCLVMAAVTMLVARPIRGAGAAGRHA